MGLPLEKKTGTNFGPPGNSKLVYFLDDLNLSEVMRDEPRAICPKNSYVYLHEVQIFMCSWYK